MTDHKSDSNYNVKSVNIKVLNVISAYPTFVLLFKESSLWRGTSNKKMCSCLINTMKN